MSALTSVQKRVSSFTLIPKSFLFVLPLSLGADLIVISGVVNKASGFYGILSLLTGAKISVMSWILHIFSIAGFPLYLYAFFALKRRNALFFLSFVHLYFIDTLIDIAFTIVFCVKWFAQARAGVSTQAVASSTISSVLSTAANASATTVLEAVKTATTAVVATGTAVLQNLEGTATVEEEFTLVTATSHAAQHLIKRTADAATTIPSKQSTSVAREDAVTILFTVFFLLVRIYCTFVLIGYARKLVRSQNLRRFNGEPKGSFSAKFQQILLTPFESFWTGYPSSGSGSNNSSRNNSGSYSPLVGNKDTKNRFNHHQPVSSIASESTLLGNPDNYSDDDENSQLNLEDMKFSGISKTSPNMRPPF